MIALEIFLGIVAAVCFLVALLRPQRPTNVCPNCGRELLPGNYRGFEGPTSGRRFCPWCKWEERKRG